MSTFNGSKYLVARKEYTCTGCGALIDAGDHHLLFQIGMMRSQRICEDCSIRRTDTGPKYDCQAVRDRLTRLHTMPAATRRA
jgi:hypothetical protein